MDGNEIISRGPAITFIVLLLLYFTGIFNVIFLRISFQKDIVGSIFLTIIGDVSIILLFWSYYKTVTITSHQLNQQSPNSIDYENLSELVYSETEIATIKAITRKSNAITQTKRLQKTQFLQDTSKIQQRHLAYTDDLTDLFDPHTVEAINKRLASDQHVIDVDTPINQGHQQQQQQVEYNQNRVFTQSEFDSFDVIDDIQQVKFCFKCEAIKPVRAHHCKACRKCILQMDHHCPWIGNCVGRDNHKQFILFLFYTSLAAIILALSVFFDYILFDSRVLSSLSESEHRQVVIMGSSCFPAALVIGGLFLFQIQIASYACTNIEFNIEEMKTHKNPFSKQSKISNLKMVMGQSIHEWFLPWIQIYPFNHRIHFQGSAQKETEVRNRISSHSRSNYCAEYTAVEL